MITPLDEGRRQHGGGTSVSLIVQAVFDWLDELFDDPTSIAVSDIAVVTHA